MTGAEADVDEMERAASICADEGCPAAARAVRDGIAEILRLRRVVSALRYPAPVTPEEGYE